MRNAVFALLAGVSAIVWASFPEKPQPIVTFTDVAARSGIRFRHDNAASAQKYLIETMGAGCAWLDYDNDGLLDLYLVQSANTPVYTAPQPLRGALYHNNGDGTFTDVTLKAGAAAAGLFGMGAAAADFDNDGFVDLLITGWNGAILYRNNGNGTFSDVTRRAGIDETGRFATSAGWFDFDNDGRLDLFIGHYVVWSPEKDQFCGEHRPGYRSYCHPDNYMPDTNSLYHNNGDGTFTDVTAKSGLGSAAGKALGVVLADFNDDGWMDIFVANDAWRNFLFLNRKDGTFEDATLSSGVGYSQDGTAEAGMGTDAADYNGDGRLDIYVAHLDRELNRLYSNQGGGVFLDATYQAGLGAMPRIYSGFGMKFIDFDNDGHPDIFVANGHILDNIELLNPAVTYAEPKLIFRNDGRGKFADVSSRLGADFAARRVSRGAAVADFDNDGDLDLLINNNGQAAQLLRCDVRNPNNWIALKLVGTKSNRDGIGARVKVIAGDLVQNAQSMGGTSYASSHDQRLFFGLGRRGRADAIEVRWPSGVVDHIKAVPANRFLTVQEGKGIIGSTPPRTPAPANPRATAR